MSGAGSGVGAGSEDVLTSAAGSGDETEAVSALEHNIKTKGKNSYYYAHANNLSKDNLGATDGTEAGPRLLHTKKKKTVKPTVKSVESYAWLDGDKRVKVYIDWEGASKLAEDATTIEHTERYIKFDITESPTVIRRFEVTKLSDDIDGVKVIKKATKFVLSMKKKEEYPWSRLKA